MNGAMMALRWTGAKPEKLLQEEQKEQDGQKKPTAIAHLFTDFALFVQHKSAIFTVQLVEKLVLCVRKSEKNH